MITYDFSVVKGDTYPGVIFQLLIDNLAVDLTGSSIRAFFRSNPNYPADLEMSTNNGKIVITEPLNGKFKFNEQLIDIPANYYNYDIEITFPGGKIGTYVGGVMTVLQDYTF